MLSTHAVAARASTTVAPPRVGTLLRWHRLRAEWPALLSAALASAIGCWVLQIWNASIDIPLTVSPGDQLFNLVLVKDVLQHGWDLTNPNLGAPLGQQLYDYPALSGDSFFMAIIKALGLFSTNPAVVVNVFYLSSFPLVAIVTYAVLRRLRLSRAVACVCSVSYAVLPFHFQSGEPHIFLSAYYTVPVSCYLMLEVLAGAELFTGDGRRPGLRAYLTWRSAAMAAVCLVLGACDTYFALFTAFLLLAMALVVLVANRRLRPFLCSLLASGLILGAAFATELPTVVYSFEHGVNRKPSVRLPVETNAFSLSLASLLMPLEDARIPALSRLAARYDAVTDIPLSTPGSEATYTNLGLIGALGLLCLGIALGVRCVFDRTPRASDARIVGAAFAAGLAFLVGTVGGIGTIFAFTVSAQLHSPSRIFLFIAFFATLAAGVALDDLRRRLGTGSVARAGFGALLAVLLAASVLYQTTPAMAPHYAAEAAEYESQREFTHTIEAQVPRGASIFQMPYRSFPGGKGRGRFVGYGELYGYLFSDTLRWSEGAMEGRSSDWVPALLRHPLRHVLMAISALGFQGVYVNLTAVGSEAVANNLQSELSSALGVAPIVSGDGQLAFFNMGPYNQALRQQLPPAQLRALARSTLHGASGAAA